MFQVGAIVGSLIAPASAFLLQGKTDQKSLAWVSIINLYFAAAKFDSLSRGWAEFLAIISYFGLIIWRLKKTVL